MYFKAHAKFDNNPKVVDTADEDSDSWNVTPANLNVAVSATAPLD